MYNIAGRVFATDNALKNHVKWRIANGYDSSLEDFYSKFYSPPSLCPFCNTRPRVLSSIFKGWSSRCGDEACKRMLQEDGIKRSILTKGKPDFLNHFKENITRYVDLFQISEDNQLIEIPYNGRTIKRKSLLLTLSKYVPEDQMTEYHETWPAKRMECVSCRIQFERTIFDRSKGDTCGDKSCITWARYHSNSKKDQAEIDTIHKASEEKKRMKILADSSVSLNFRGNDVRFPVSRLMSQYDLTVLCNDVFVDSNLSLADFLNECLGGCCVCHNTLTVEKSHHYLKRFKNEGKRCNVFCSKECYFDAKTKQKGLYVASEEYRKKTSERMKDKIANGEFTPVVTNSWARSRTIVGNLKFRSSWEAAFWICNQSYEYEKVRIPYTFQGNRRNYIVDFFDPETNTLYEIKPDSNREHLDVLAKEQAAIDFCNAKLYNYKIVGNSWFFENYAIIIANAKLFDTLDEKFYARMEQFNDNRYQNNKNSKDHIDRNCESTKSNGS